MQTDRVFPSCWKSRTQSPESSKAGALRLGEDFEDHVLKWRRSQAKTEGHILPLKAGEKNKARLPAEQHATNSRHHHNLDFRYFLPLHRHRSKTCSSMVMLKNCGQKCRFSVFILLIFSHKRIQKFEHKWKSTSTIKEKMGYLLDEAQVPPSRESCEDPYWKILVV